MPDPAREIGFRSLRPAAPRLQALRMPDHVRLAEARQRHFGALPVDQAVDAILGSDTAGNTSDPEDHVKGDDLDQLSQCWDARLR